MKVCAECNKEKELSEFRLVSNKYYRNTCKKCEQELNQIQSKPTKEYIDSFKKECSICGYNKCKVALEFHHINREDKKFELTRLRTRKWTENAKRTIDEEMKKCIVVCSNCHTELHNM